MRQKQSEGEVERRIIEENQNDKSERAVKGRKRGTDNQMRIKYKQLEQCDGRRKNDRLTKWGIFEVRSKLREMNINKE